MDQLKQYKNLWKNQEISEKWGQTDLYKMMHKSSSSLVKWIFYISIIEFTFFTLLNLFVRTDWRSQYEPLGLYNFMIGVHVVSYIILITFIILFYRNYKKIQATQSVKSLMQSIINTRKTVKYYIFINLFGIVVVSIYSFSRSLKTVEYEGLVEQFGPVLIWVIVLAAIFFIVGILFLIYALIYGYFLRRLRKNYKELTDEIMDL